MRAHMVEGRISDEALADFAGRVGMTLRIPHRFNEAATRDAIRKFVDGIGDANPLWRDETYARRTPYGRIVAPPSWLNSVFPTWVLQGLPGVHAIQTGTDWEFHLPILEGDRIFPECRFTGYEVKETQFAGRSVMEKQTARYVNQDGELVAEAHPTGLRCERSGARRNGRDSRLKLPHPWTEPELAAIEEEVLQEEVRGGRPRYWEDVRPGQELPPLVKGPLGLSDVIAYCVGASPVPLRAHGLSLREYRKHPAWFFRDPDTSALEPIYSVHYNRMAAESAGLPYPYDAAVQRNCWLIQFLTNWSGDQGWIKSSHVEYRGFVYLSDVVRLRGRVVDKYIDPAGEGCVDLVTSTVNQRAEEVMPGRSTVILPSRSTGFGPLDRRLGPNGRNSLKAGNES